MSAARVRRFLKHRWFSDRGPGPMPMSQNRTNLKFFPHPGFGELRRVPCGNLVESFPELGDLPRKIVHEASLRLEKVDTHRLFNFRKIEVAADNPSCEAAPLAP